MAHACTMACSQADEGNNCSICVEPLADGLVIISCGHVFHQRCIARCEKRECPLCRTSLCAKGPPRKLLPHLVCDDRVAPAKGSDPAAGGETVADLLAHINEASERKVRLRAAISDSAAQFERLRARKRELESKTVRVHGDVERLLRLHARSMPVDEPLLSHARIEPSRAALEPAALERQRARLASRCRELLRGKLELKKELRASALKEQEEARLLATIAQLKTELEGAQQELEREQRASTSCDWSRGGGGSGGALV